MFFLQRPAFAPSKFLTVARPSWFTFGAQQDCSEFLKFLLDKLDVEDKDLKGSASQSVPVEDAGNDSVTKDTTQENVCESKEKLHTLVDESFAGKLLVNHLCRRCNNLSSREEVFTDLPLAFPLENDWLRKPCSNEESAKEPSENFDSLSGSTSVRSLKGGDISKNPISPSGPPETMEDSAGPSSGKAQGSTSSSDPFPISKPLEPAVHGAAESTFGLESLLHYFLEPEVLEGGNRYFCENCQSLQDAERSVVITKHPLYLVLALKRFSFDVRTQARAKILYHVSYPLSLQLPSVHAQHNMELGRKESSVVDNGNTTDSEERKCGEESHVQNEELNEQTTTEMIRGSETCDRQASMYSLCSVIVHSGTSSDSGHYYCYARSVSNTTLRSSLHEEQAVNSNMGQQHVENGEWYLFNDSRISYASFSTFASITTRFPKDTPYVFIYRRSTPLNPIGEQVCREKLNLPRVHWEAVQQDNLMYLQVKATYYYHNFHLTVEKELCLVLLPITCRNRQRACTLFNYSTTFEFLSYEKSA